MQEEIGGYFGFEQLSGNEYYSNLIALNTGRNALLYLIKARKIKKIYLPYFLCDSIVNMCRENECSYELYNISWDFTPQFTKKLSADEYILIVNYFGQLANGILKDLKQLYVNIIVDNTQAFFQKPLESVDTIYSCRKFFGVSDGAYLSTKMELKEILYTDSSKDRMMHILGRYEGLASDYYSIFKYHNARLKDEPLKFMSKLTHNILGAIDYDRVRQRRNENYTYLHSKLEKYNVINPLMPDGPFAYPFFVENGLEIKKMLALKKIYIPTYWPNVLSENLTDSIEYKFASNILPLPCDQRYGLDDMAYVLKHLLV